MEPRLIATIATIATSPDPTQFRPNTLVQVQGRPYLVTETRPKEDGGFEALGRPVQA